VLRREEQGWEGREVSCLERIAYNLTLYLLYSIYFSKKNGYFTTISLVSLR